jgi:hypothetical protein
MKLPLLHYITTTSKGLLHLASLAASTLVFGLLVLATPFILVILFGGGAYLAGTIFGVKPVGFTLMGIAGFCLTWALLQCCYQAGKAESDGED